MMSVHSLQALSCLLQELMHNLVDRPAFSELVDQMKLSQEEAQIAHLHAQVLKDLCDRHVASFTPKQG